MRNSLNLSQQGLILVGLPIGLMLMFLVSLLLLFLKVEKEAKETDHSKTVIATANSLVKEYYDAASRLIIYKHTRSEDSRQEFENQLAETESGFKQLRTLVSNDKEELKMLAQLRRVALQGMFFMRRYEKHLDYESRRGGEKLDDIQVTILYKQLADCGSIFTSRLQELVAHETARHRINSTEEERTRTLVKVWILAGVLVAVCSGVVLCVCFTRNTTSRLALLMDNTRRLSKKEPLLPRLAGEDEISNLDHFFHKMADDLAEAARKERAILDNAVDVICSINPEGRFVAVNPASLQVWGYQADKLTGMHFSDILVEKDIPRFVDSLEEIRKNKTPINLETEVQAADDRVVHTLWSLRWSERENVSFCVAHDISDRKEVERVKQEFVAVISHELRTPLTSLQMTLSLLLDGTYGQLSNTAQKRVRSAEFGISRLISLINDLLDIEKMEAGKLTMNFTEGDIAEIVQRSVESVQGFAEQQQVTVTYDVKHSVTTFDLDRIIQVLVNLLSNAIKFSDDGGRVQVAMQVLADGTEVQVIDHGAGVPEGSEQSIFGKYEQAHTDRSKRRKGTGLGLPICKAIIEQHGGTIGVRKTEGGGSTFYFILPGKVRMIAEPTFITAERPLPVIR